MSRRLLASFVFNSLAACATGKAADPASQPVTQDHYSYRAPADWERHDQDHHNKAHRSSTVEWVPTDNPRKEALTVIRTTLEPHRPNDPASIERLLVDAQQSLPHHSVGAVTRFTSEKGLRGAEVDTVFTPDGATRPYYRQHSVLIDGGTLIHVLYTSPNPASHEALELVVNSLQREG